MNSGDISGLEKNPTIINLTPHDIKFLGEDKNTIVYILPPSGLARCIAYRVHERYIKLGSHLIEMASSSFANVEGMYGEEPNTIYIVSKPVADALRGIRDDVYIVDRVVRNKQGVVIGCRGLARII